MDQIIKENGQTDFEQGLCVSQIRETLLYGIKNNFQSE
jgi:hypothetical protein